MANDEPQGGCLCNSIRYRFTGLPLAKASAIADRAGSPLARRPLHGSWLSAVISLLLPVTLCGFAHLPPSSEHSVENVGRH